MTKHTILFLPANPAQSDPRKLDVEARVIQEELARSGRGQAFEFVTRWAVQPLDVLRELRSLKPTVVHFTSGRCGADKNLLSAEPPGLFFQGPNGESRFVSSEALRRAFDAAGVSVKLVVFNGCYDEAQAEALLPQIGCVAGSDETIVDAAARAFSIGFYGGLGEQQSISAAYQQGRAAISLEGLPEPRRLQLRVRDGIDAELLVLTRPSPVTGSARTESQNAVTMFRVHCGLAQLQFAAMNPGIIRLRPEQLLDTVVDGARSLGLLVGDKDSAIRALSPQALSSKILDDTEQTLPPLLAVARLAQVATIRLLYRGTSIEDSNVQEVMTLELTAKVCSDEIGIPDDSFMSWHKSQFAQDANPQLIMKRLEELVRAAFR